MITLESVTKRYTSTTAVEELTLTVEEGEFTVLIGPSGCGKSTTLRMINRLIPASGGRIEIDGVDVKAYKPEELRRRIGYAIQSVGLFPHMTVAENVGVVPGLLKWEKKRADSRTDELLTLFGLDPAIYRSKYPNQLSGGESQRVGVARALAADPSILLMDEPFGALDPITRESLQTEFARIQKDLKKTIVFVTHDIDEAMRLASRIVIMREGRLIQHDTPEKILETPADKFVQEFIGADRALKKLSRLTADSILGEASSVSIDLEVPVSTIHSGKGYVWVVDGEGIVQGWVDEGSTREAGAKIFDVMTHSPWRSFAIMKDATLKEALSRMVGEGIRSAPVVDSSGRLLGEITLERIMAS